MPADTTQGAAAVQQALSALRQAIQNGDMAPGRRLVETELAEAYRVTRASVRAALIELTSEGLVERIPNRGARVRAVPLAEAIAITECRMVLEGLCAAKAAEAVTDEQIGLLRTIGDRMTRAVDEGEPLRYAELNTELHRLVREISGQEVATGLIARLRGPIIRRQFRLSPAPCQAKVSICDHLAIIEAISARDPEAAELAARKHVAGVVDALRATAAG
ncbi:GntR family transcriptional regulator [Amycolatopsis sp. NPDC059021]|uniref:GntR family transcriptional regulator n=1 Tax=Amycolatopsis sp. NPDC059021 TaxID=3346704 RepID=UPI00366B70F2